MAGGSLLEETNATLKQEPLPGSLSVFRKIVRMRLSVAKATGLQQNGGLMERELSGVASPAPC